MSPLLLLPFFVGNLNIIFIYKFILIKIDSNDNTSEKAKNFFSHVSARRCVLVDSSLSLPIAKPHLVVPSSCEAECWNWIFGWNVSVSDIHCCCSLLYLHRSGLLRKKSVRDVNYRLHTAIFCLIRLGEHRVSSGIAFCRRCWWNIQNLRWGKRVKSGRRHFPGFASSASRLNIFSFNLISIIR